MVKIPYIKIPSVRVGSIGPTSNIGDGGATPAPPTPITYLTQWQMMGNSVVHTDEYLTQWKVEGNSVVDNNAILSCGDLGQDGKYHVKISNGVDVYDISLDEPLRKVNDVADKIEFANGIAVVTRAYKKLDWVQCSIKKSTTSSGYKYFAIDAGDIYYQTMNILSSLYNVYSINVSVANFNGLGVGCGGNMALPILRIVNSEMENYTAEEFRAANANVDIIYELATPTTETIQAPQIAVSSAYTSANDVAYSSFTYANPLIYSCGDYSDVDGKYHILVQPLGGSIADIALDEPLRKVNDVADSIEFADGVATLTRNFGNVDLGNINWSKSGTNKTSGEGKYRFYSQDKKDYIKQTSANSVANILSGKYNAVTANQTYEKVEGIGVNEYSYIYIYDDNYNKEGDANNLKNSLHGVKIIYELATPTTETIQVPQIEEADSYSCVISQGAKAVEWSSFETDSE